MFSFRLYPIMLVLLVAALAGCSDSTAPGDPGGGLGSVNIEGSIDPGAGTFVLKTLDVPTPDGPPIRVQLIGSDLTTNEPDQTVSIMVAVRSLHYEPLYPPAMIWISQLQPGWVEVLNPDAVYIPFQVAEQANPIDEVAYGFDYSELLGDDGMLHPEETSAAKEWVFMSPDLAAFGFAARAEFGLAPDLARIGGLCFFDDNRNGVPDPDESPLPHGVVTVRTPGGETIETMVGPEGLYALHVFEEGLYEVFYDPMIDTFAPIAFSTPNPWQVVLAMDPDGQLQSFMDANFGLYTDIPPGPPPIQFTDLPPDSLHYELWNLIEVGVVEDHLMRLEVGFSGCQPDHPFSLWMSGGFMESEPVQVNLVPVHDLAEDCDAAFTGVRHFNLWPLRARFLEAYGPGVLMMNVIDFNGEVHQVEWGIFPPD